MVANETDIPSHFINDLVSTWLTFQIVFQLSTHFFSDPIVTFIQIYHWNLILTDMVNSELLFQFSIILFKLASHFS